MSRPVPIVPEVLLLGTLPNPGDLERSIRLQLTPGSGPAPEMAMAAAGAPGRAGRLRGPGGAATGLRPRHRRRPRRLGPVDGSVGGRAGAGAGADAAGEATGFRERRRIGVSELQRRTLHPAEPARPRRRGRPGGRAVHPSTGATAQRGRGRSTLFPPRRPPIDKLCSAGGRSGPRPAPVLAAITLVGPVPAGGCSGRRTSERRGRTRSRGDLVTIVGVPTQRS